MSDDRKYKQRGYQEGDSRPLPPSRTPGGIGGKKPTFSANREAVRCDSCGTELSIHFEIVVGSHCPKCVADLHTCRNCLHLDPSARFECARPIAARAESKTAGNACELFDARRLNVKETTFSTTRTPEDARKALEDLFKK